MKFGNGFFMSWREAQLMNEKNLSHALAKLIQACVSGRSEAYRWMRDNHAELSVVLETRRPS